MSLPEPEFSRPVRLDCLGDRPKAMTLEANEAERAALAKRFGLIAIEALSGTVELVKRASGIGASGRIVARITQRCVATGEPVPAVIDEAFALDFIEQRGVEAEEIELGEDDLDTVEFEGQAVDIGEALAQTLALALEPFPRSADADAILKQAGVLSEEEAGPFSALADLKKALEGKPKG